MAERNSKYTRIEGDNYSTPGWVTKALLDVEVFEPPIWECAPGDGHMVRMLEMYYPVVQSPPSTDFLSAPVPGNGRGTARSIITNPPYVIASEFCRRAIKLMIPRHGKVAMLLPMAFDCASGRRDLFADCEHFSAKLTLTRRIRWANVEQKSAGPSMNHAWYVWDWHHHGAPTLKYLSAGGV